MNRFFGHRQGAEAFLSAPDAHHLLNVLRMKVGEKIEVADDGDLFLCSIQATDPLKIKIDEKIECHSELPSDLCLAFSLLKNGHDELVLQKGTELGVRRFIPFVSKRSIIKLDEKGKKKKLERYEKIVEGAASQSKRLFIPEVSPILIYDDVLKTEADHRYIAYEELSKGDSSLLSELSKIKGGEKTICLIGPEGGFEGKEVEKAKEAGFLPISLGKRILRAETASIYFASVFSLIIEAGK